MQATNPSTIRVADGQGVCSHVGAALLGELSDRLGLTGELGRRANLGVRAGAYERGQVLRDLVVMLADFCSLRSPRSLDSAGSESSSTRVALVVGQLTDLTG